MGRPKSTTVAYKTPWSDLRRFVAGWELFCPGQSYTATGDRQTPCEIGNLPLIRSMSGCAKLRIQTQNPAVPDIGVQRKQRQAVRIRQRCGSPYSPDRKGVHPRTHLKDFRGTLQADGYAGFDQLYDAPIRIIRSRKPLAGRTCAAILRHPCRELAGNEGDIGDRLGAQRTGYLFSDIALPNRSAR